METFQDFLNSHELLEIKEKHFNFDNYISHYELEAIFKGIDKTDFSSCGVSRWNDLDKIVCTICSKKKYFSEYKLKKIILIHQEETWPPVNYYHYEFVN